MVEQLIKFFVVFFVVVEPISLIPLVRGAHRGREPPATRGDGVARRRRSRSAICVLFALGGARFLDLMGISLNSFRIAGGTLLFLIVARDGVRPQLRNPLDHARTRGMQETRGYLRFPAGISLHRGAGRARHHIADRRARSGASPCYSAGFLGVVALVILVCLSLMLAAPRLMKVLGVTGANVMNRLSGVILAALAVQFISRWNSRQLLVLAAPVVGPSR